MSEKLGRYRLTKLLATGGMGEVFLARQEGPGGFVKMVVVKRILRHLARDQGFIDLFLNEARLAAQLQHPNITQVFTLEHEADAWFITMEYVHGKSLRQVLDCAKARGSSVPATIACRLASQVLQGLHFAHELTDERGHALGILHRDVTPENVLISFSGLVKLIDFGIARAMSGAGVLRVGNPKGKVGYMAPELTVSGAVVDRRADVYAVGVVLYEMLKLGAPPNTPRTVEEAQQPRAPYADEVMIPRALNEVLAKAMAPDPADRYPSAHAMSEALELYLMAVGQTVLPAHVGRYLMDLFGPETAGANASVVALQGGGEWGNHSTGQLLASGTAPLGQGTAALPLGGSAVGVSALTPIVVEELETTASHAAPPPPSPSLPPARRSWTPLVVGAGTLVVLGFLVGLAFWPRDRVEPRAVAEARLDAGELTVEPDAPPRVDAGELAGPDAEPASPAEPVATRELLPKDAAHKAGGRVLLKTPSGTEVFYGGKRLGVTPLAAPVDVTPGIATFLLRNARLGVSRKVSVRVVPGGTVVLKADLASP